MPKVLIAGASGNLGRHVVARFKQMRPDEPIRVLSRSRESARRVPLDARDEIVLADAATDPTALATVCDGVEVVFSSLGASVAPQSPEKRPYKDVDFVANKNLVDVARWAGARRFVYVSVFSNPSIARTAYVRAHEDAARAVKASGLEWAVLRPTGFFSAFAAILEMARTGGAVPQIGDGNARSNPIDDRDLAAVCVDAILSDAKLAAETALGGPEILTRRKMTDLAFAALGQPPRYRGVMPLAAAIASPLVGSTNKRMRDLMEFVSALSKNDVIAPAVGTRRLADFYQEIAPGAAEV